MRFGSTAKVLLKCKLKYYRISECVLSRRSDSPQRCCCKPSVTVSQVISNQVRPWRMGRMLDDSHQLRCWIREVHSSWHQQQHPCQGKVGLHTRTEVADHCHKCFPDLTAEHQKGTCQPKETHTGIPQAQPQTIGRHKIKQFPRKQAPSGSTDVIAYKPLPEAYLRSC